MTGTGRGLSAFTRIYSLLMHTRSTLQTFMCHPRTRVNGRDRLLGFSRAASGVLKTMFSKGAGPVQTQRKQALEAPICVWPEQPQAPPSGRPGQGGHSAGWPAGQQAGLEGWLSQAAILSSCCNTLTFKVCAMFKDFKNNDSKSHQGNGQGCFGQCTGPHAPRRLGQPSPKVFRLETQNISSLFSNLTDLRYEFSKLRTVWR